MLYLMLVLVFNQISKKWWIFFIIGWGKIKIYDAYTKYMYLIEHNKEDNLSNEVLIPLEGSSIYVCMCGDDYNHGIKFWGIYVSCSCSSDTSGYICWTNS